MTPETVIDERLAAMLDRAEISGLIDRYVITLDTADEPGHDTEWYRTIFTDDVWLSFPIGDRQGVADLAEFQRRAKRGWQTTHHLSGNHVIDLHGDTARVRVQIVGTHVEWGANARGTEPGGRFDMGGYYAAEALRTPHGWRIASLRFELSWTAGTGTPRTEERNSHD